MIRPLLIQGGDAHKQLEQNMSTLPFNQIIQGNSIELMQQLPEESVNMIFADPPRSLQLERELLRPDHPKVGGVAGDWGPFADFKGYDRFSHSWLSAARRVLKPDGTIWVTGSYHNIFRVGTALQDMGFWLLNDVIWIKNNPMPDFRERRLANAHETMIWCAKSKNSRYTFNCEAMKELNEGLHMRSDWTLPICNDSERLEIAKNPQTDPVRKPESLFYRVLIASTVPGDTVLDPFSGTGTSCAVAKKLGRKWIGFEQDHVRVAASRKRLDKISEINAEAIARTKLERREAKIPFGHLVECGFLQPGTLLESYDRRHVAKVRADGTIISSEHKGSIHQVGAALQGAPSCNGWTYWMTRSNKKPIPINMIRQKILQNSQMEARHGVSM